MLFISILFVSCSSTKNNCQVAHYSVLSTGCSYRMKNRFHSLLEHEGMEIEIYTVIKKGMKNRLEQVGDAITKTSSYTTMPA
jgi:hypothetical protein